MAEQSEHTDSTVFVRRVNDDDEGVLVDAWGREVEDTRVTESGQVTGEDTSTGTYSDWSNQQLTDEIKRRRDAGREIHLEGRTKADAIAALEKDDAEAAQSEG